MMEAFFAAKDVNDDITLRFSALEIYNDKLIDLLAGYGSSDGESIGTDNHLTPLLTSSLSISFLSALILSLSSLCAYPPSLFSYITLVCLFYFLLPSHLLPSLTRIDSSEEKLLHNQLEIRETSSGMNVKGLKRPIVRTVTQGLDCLFEAQMNRAIAEHEVCAS